MCFISYIPEGSSGLLKQIEYCERTRPGTLCKYVHEEAPPLSDTASIRSASSRSSYPTTPTSMAGAERYYNLELRAPESKESRDYQKERKHKSDRKYIIAPEIVFRIGSSSKKDDKKEDSRRSRSATNHRTLLSPIDASYNRSSSDHRSSSSRSSTTYSTRYSPQHSPQRMPFAPDPPSVVPDAEPVYIINSSLPRRTPHHSHTTQNETEYTEPSSPTIRRPPTVPKPVVIHQHSTPYRVEERKPGWVSSSQSTRSPSVAPSTRSEASSWRYERDTDSGSVRDEIPSTSAGSKLSKEEKARRQAEYDEQERIRWLNRTQEREEHHRKNEERRQREEGDWTY